MGHCEWRQWALDENITLSGNIKAVQEAAQWALKKFRISRQREVHGAHYFPLEVGVQTCTDCSLRNPERP